MEKEAQSDYPVEHCGVVGGIDYSGTDMVRRTIVMLNEVSHRGRDSAGISTVNHGFHSYKDYGHVKDIFTDEVIESQNLVGPLATGHTRYKNQGGDTLAFTQTFVAEYEGWKMAFGHNGNIPELSRQRARLNALGLCAFPDYDSNILAQLIVSAEGDNWIEKVQNGLVGVEGSYSIIMATGDGHLVVARDPWGIRPLSVARIEDGVVAASETKAFNAIKAKHHQEVQPGEILDFSTDGEYRSKLLEEADKRSCIFENIYFMHETSEIEGETASRFRQRLGESLAKNHRGEGKVVTAVPDSSSVAANSYATETAKPIERLILKKPDSIERSFMKGEMGSRIDTLEAKFDLSPDAKGQSIDAVDDSIIIGNTTKFLAQNLREDVGAAEVHVLSTAPKVIRDCPWGINMRSSDGDFAAVNKETGETLSDDEIARNKGLDSVRYNTLEELQMVAEEGGHNPEDYCYHCFGGQGLSEPKMRNVVSIKQYEWKSAPDLVSA